MSPGGSRGTCVPSYNGGATIVVPVNWVGAAPPKGTFRACRNEECYPEITAEVPVMGPSGLSVAVSFRERTVGLSWNGHFLGEQRDRYRLAFTAVGDSLEIPVFDTTVTYLVMRPDTPSPSDCLTGSFANVSLTERVDLTPGATGGEGGTTGEAGAGGAGGAIVDGGEGGTSGAAGS
ncbi:MAG: hypothetical protein ABUL62_08175 [Myxococcales bacterium]